MHLKPCGQICAVVKPTAWTVARAVEAPAIAGNAARQQAWTCATSHNRDPPNGKPLDTSGTPCLHPHNCCARNFVPRRTLTSQKLGHQLKSIHNCCDHFWRTEHQQLHVPKPKSSATIHPELSRPRHQLPPDCLHGVCSGPVGMFGLHQTQHPRRIQLRCQQIDKRLLHGTQATSLRNLHENEGDGHMKVALPFVPPQAQFSAHCFTRADLSVLAPSGTFTRSQGLRRRPNVQKTLQLLPENSTVNDGRLTGKLPSLVATAKSEFVQERRMYKSQVFCQ